MKILLALSFFIAVITFSSCKKEDNIINTLQETATYGGYMTFTTIQKTQNQSPMVNIQTSWQQVEVTTSEPDSIFFKVRDLPRIGFACNEIHTYETYHGTSGHTEISISNDTISLFHMEKTGNNLAYLQETWEFEGIKTK